MGWWTVTHSFAATSHSTISYDVGDTDNDSTPEIVSTDMKPYNIAVPFLAPWLPVILGRDGWLALSRVPRGRFVAHLPGLATATRLDIHFWWNFGEPAWLAGGWLQPKLVYETDLNGRNKV